jgi:hypothetical protein
MRMKFDTFVSRLFDLGFAEPRVADPPHVVRHLKEHPYIRSFEPPANLRSAISWLNTGGSSLEDYSVTVQGLNPTFDDLKEWGDHGDYSFGAMEPNEELLSALASGAHGFTAWFNSSPVFSFDAEDEDGNTVQGIATADGKSYSGGGQVN